MVSPQQTLGGLRWQQRDGTLIRISEMSDAHLENALALCVRVGYTLGIKVLAEEMEHRNDNMLLDDCVVGGCDCYGSLSPD